MQIDYFMENIKPYVLQSTPNVLSVGRRCRHEGYGFYWEPYAPTPRMVSPAGIEVPVEIHGDIPYFRDVTNLSLRDQHRGKDAVPAATLEGNLQPSLARQRDAAAAAALTSTVMSLAADAGPADVNANIDVDVAAEEQSENPDLDVQDSTEYQDEAAEGEPTARFNKDYTTNG